MIDSSLVKAEGSYRHGNLREALVQCGLTILERDGLAKLSLRKAAKLAGVSQTAPAHHFGDKSGLLAAIATEGYRELVRRRLKALHNKKTPEERLRCILETYVEFAVARPAIFQLMFGPFISNYGKHPELIEACRASFNMVAQAVSEYLYAKGFRPSDEQVFSVSAWVGVHGLAALLVNLSNAPITIRRVPISLLKKELVGIILAGIIERRRAAEPAGEQEARA